MYQTVSHRVWLMIALVIVIMSGISVTHAQELPTATPAVSTFDDGGSDILYKGTHWQHCSACGQKNGVYDQTDSWDNVSGELARLHFDGAQIAIYGVTGPANGIAGVTVDNEPEVLVDFYDARTLGNQLLWQDDQLSFGEHNISIRVSGMHNANSTDNYISLDRIDVTANPPAPVAITARVLASTSQPSTPPFEDIRWSPDSHLLAIQDATDSPGNFTMTVQIWDVGSGSMLRTVGPTVFSMFFWSPDSQSIATLDNKKLEFWDVNSGQLLRTLSILNPAYLPFSPSTAAWSPDGKLLALSYADKGLLSLVDASTGKEIRMLDGKSVGAVWSPDGTTIAASDGRRGALWDTQTGHLLRPLINTGFESVMPGDHQLAWSPDGKTIASTTGKGVQLSDVATGQPIRLINSTTLAAGTDVSWSPDSKLVVFGGSLIQISDVATGKLVSTLAPTQFDRLQVEWSPDGKMLALTDGKTVWLSDVSAVIAHSVATLTPTP